MKSGTDEKYVYFYAPLFPEQPGSVIDKYRMDMSGEIARETQIKNTYFNLSDDMISYFKVSQTEGFKEAKRKIKLINYCNKR